MMNSTMNRVKSIVAIMIVVLAATSCASAPPQSHRAVVIDRTEIRLCGIKKWSIDIHSRGEESIVSPPNSICVITQAMTLHGASIRYMIGPNTVGMSLTGDFRKNLIDKSESSGLLGPCVFDPPIVLEPGVELRIIGEPSFGSDSAELLLSGYEILKDD